MSNVIRQDIIAVGFEIDLKELTKLNRDLDELRKKLTGNTGYDPFEKIKQGSKESVPPLEKVKKSTEDVKEKLNDIGRKASVTAFNGIKRLAGISFRALTTGLGRSVTSFGVLVKQSVSAYADYEQFIGGVETLFKDNAEIVQKYANNAYKTAGLSANQYMETITGFSASLLQSLGGDTKKAAAYGDMAISDMSDNANKMGTDMGAIQFAYQGFAKQNYTMLDNLKLGYGGTKTEMERLVKDAAKVDKSIDASSLSYANVVKAIHAVQIQTGIYGTTQKEAEKTITGSLNSMKSAWSNLLPALIQGGDSFDQCVDNLVSTVGIFAENIKPAIIKALSGMGKLIEKLAPIIEQEFPKIVDELLPPLIKAATALFIGLIKALPNIIKTVAKEIPNILKQFGAAIGEAFGAQFAPLKKFGDFSSENAGKIAKFIPVIIGLVAAFKLFSRIKGIGSGLSGLFGKSSDAGTGGKGGKGGIIGWLSGLAKIKPTTILKGMANLAIILGGFVVLAAAFMAVAPYLAKLTDFKSIIEVIGVIAVLGGVGAALAKLASIVGKIPVVTVAKGLANIAIIIGGMSALFLLVGAVSLINFDLKKIMHITKIIAVIGTVGSALALFAGIVGIIPIPVVLLGLANIALVIAGMSAIIIAFGALSNIPHFDEFITKGGEILVKICNILGEMVGSIIGGVGVGITNSLPQIGENLSAFALSLKPMFTVFSGVDMNGIGAFFGAIGGFMLQMAGEKILSFFTGGIDFAGFGKKLTEFATSSKGFFDKVATFPAMGFSNATALFQSLADIGNIPNTGGIAQWFAGETGFEALANGLVQLSSDGVIGFYNKMAVLPTTGFENAKALFQSLSDIEKVVPKTNGFAQFFAGTNDFTGLSEKLPPFGVAMAAFYSSISGISDFSKAKQLFEALKGMEEAIPKSGGFAQFFAGENNISGVGFQLKQFGLDTKDFFTQVSALNIGNLNGVWDSVRKASEIATLNLNGLSGKGTELTNFMSNVKGFFSGASGIVEYIGAVNNVAAALQSFFAIISGIVTTSLAGINNGLTTMISSVVLSTGYFTSFGVAILNSSTIGASAFLLLRMTVSQQMALMDLDVKNKCNSMLLTLKSMLAEMKTAISSVDLKSSGADMMDGLINGLNSKKSAVISTARTIGEAVKTEINKALDINSPSKELFKTGQFTGQGQVLGMKDTLPEVKKTANELGTASIPYYDTYTPDSDSSTYSTANDSTEVNNYSPSFNLTISGSNDDRTTARKVKRWINEAMEDYFDSMGRKNPKLRQV